VTAAADEIPPDLKAPRRKLVDPRTLPARFHHLRAAGLCGAHCLQAFQGDSPDTLAKRLGSGAHAVTFDKRVAVWNRPAKKNSKKPAPRSGNAWKDFQRENAGAVILTIKEHDHARRIRDAIRGHAIAERLLFGPMVHERSIIWSECGRARQSTPDARGVSHNVELKTTRCAAPLVFARDAERLAYHAQLADQRAAIAYERQGRAPRESYIVAVESAPPHVVQVYEVPESLLERGDQLRLAWLERLQIYEATNLWRGYSERIETLEFIERTAFPVADPSWVSDETTDNTDEES
jgi:hypothetical protein